MTRKLQKDKWSSIVGRLKTVWLQHCERNLQFKCESSKRTELPLFGMLLAPAPGTVTLPRERATQTHIEREAICKPLHMYGLSTVTAGGVRHVNNQRFAGSLRESSQLYSPVAQIYHWGSLMAAFITYYCLIFSSPSSSPQKFLFCSYF